MPCMVWAWENACLTPLLEMFLPENTLTNHHLFLKWKVECLFHWLVTSCVPSMILCRVIIHWFFCTMDVIILILLNPCNDMILSWHFQIITHRLQEYKHTARAEHLADIKFGDLGENAGWLTFSLVNQLSSKLGWKWGWWWF